MGAWEDGFAAGWAAASERTMMGIPTEPVFPPTRTRKSKSKKKPREASAYSKRYGAAFKRLAPRYKKKAGGWKKDGFRRCAAAARKEAKR